MSTRVKCSILVPVYNERKAILQNVRAINVAVRAELGGAPYEVLLVDNGSTDGTGTIAPEIEESEPEVRLHHIATKGRGAALRFGFGVARGEYIAVLSIDRAWEETFLGEAIRLLDSERVDVVYGPKSHPESRVDRPMYRHLASGAVRAFVFLYFGVTPRDTQCIKCFRRAAVPFLEELHDYNYFAETEFFLRASRAGIAERSIGVKVTDRRRESKVGVSSFFELLGEARHFRRTVWKSARG